MDLNIDTLANLQGMTSETGAGEELYEKMLHYLHYQINQKDIVFSKELRKQFNLDENDSLKFDIGFFEAQEYNPLFVHMAAIADQEVYQWLEYAFNKTHNQKFSAEILNSEIKRLKDDDWMIHMVHYWIHTSEDDEIGIIYPDRSFTVGDSSEFEIFKASSEHIDNDQVKITVYIDYLETYKNFSAVIKNTEKFKKVTAYNPGKRKDYLYLIIRDQIDKDILEWISEIEKGASF